MLILKTVQELRDYRQSLDDWNEGDTRPSIGFVPTMGALHSGHASLIERAKAENSIAILSIFVNPTQFNNSDDLKNYPQTWDSDLALARAKGASAIFAPAKFEQIYPDGYRYGVIEKEFSRALCGEFRPGHFDGVLTVVLKLLNLVRPDRAYFGEKDYQQLSLIRGMAEAFFLRTEIVACPTLREEDGLAMSSRNLRLTPGERAKAPILHRAMTRFHDVQDARRELEDQGFQIEYLLDRDGRRFAAAWLGKVRLIDNVELATPAAEKSEVSHD